MSGSSEFYSMTVGKNAEQQGMTDSQNPHEEDVDSFILFIRKRSRREFNLPIVPKILSLKQRFKHRSI